MSDAVKVAAAGIIAAICAMTVRKQVPELALLLALCTGVLMVLYCSGALAAITGFMEELTEAGGLSPDIVSPVFKATGIAIVTRLGANVCRDAGEGAVASGVEGAGAILALLVVLPLMSGILELMKELLV